MNCISLNSRAKINLTLDVISKRSDGYHEVEMIMQSLELCDEIYIEKIPGGKIEIKSNSSAVPLGCQNTAYKAAKLIQDKFGVKDGVFMRITKRIPVQAGLAGGSGNGAAALKGMNILFDLNIPNEKILELAAEIGSDVPFCVLEGTAIARGRGEILTPIKPCPRFFVALAKPPEGVSTAEIYGNLKLEEIVRHPDTKKAVGFIEKGDKKGICRELSNVLEEVTIPRLPAVGKVKEFFMHHGAHGALMCGSGPTVFALFDSLEMAEQAAAAVKNKFLLDEVIVTRIFNP